MEVNRFAVVKYVADNNTTGIVANNWLSHDQQWCLEPDATGKKRDRLLRIEAPPNEKWTKHPVSVMRKYATYEKARKGLRKSEDTSNLSSSEEEDGERRRCRRQDEPHNSSERTPKRRKFGPTCPVFPGDSSQQHQQQDHLNTSNHSQSLLPPPPSYIQQNYMSQHQTDTLQENNYSEQNHTNSHHSQHNNSHHSQHNNSHHSQHNNSHHSQHNNSHHSQHTNSHHSQHTNPHHSQHTNHHSQHTNPHHSQHNFSQGQSFQSVPPHNSQPIFTLQPHLPNSHNISPIQSHNSNLLFHSEPLHSPMAQQYSSEGQQFSSEPSNLNSPLHPFTPLKEQVLSQNLHNHNESPAFLQPLPRTSTPKTPIPVTNQNMHLNSQTPTDNERISRIEEIVTDISVQLSIQNNKLDQLLQYFDIRKQNEEVDSIRKELPVESMEEFAILDKKLEERAYEKKLLKLLCALGGRDYKIYTTNMLKRILTDSLAMGFSYTGRKWAKDKEKEPFGTTNICRIIHDCVQKRLGTEVTDDKIKQVVSCWLQQAKTRLVRRDKTSALRDENKKNSLQNENENSPRNENGSEDEDDVTGGDETL